MKGYRWRNTGVWQLEESGTRHFVGSVQRLSDGTFSWTLPGGFCVSKISDGMGNESGSDRWYLCGEVPTLQEGKRAVEKLIFAIHRYCLGTSFGKHDYAVFDFENGEPVVRAVGTVKHCQRYVTPGRLIVSVSKYRKVYPDLQEIRRRPKTPRAHRGVSDSEDAP
jgi:hypothetical protein